MPLLANPQAAVLYPLHWPLIWLPVTKQVYWSAAVHTWLLGMGGYCLLRYWGSGVWASLVTALVLSGAGIVGGLIGHLNQLNVAAWGPWAVLCIEGANLGSQGSTKARWPGVLARSAALGLVVALMLLAGHTQTVYIVLFGLGLWCLWPAVQRQWRETVARLIVYAAGVVLGALLSAPQLLPTLELSGLGLRTGGLNYLDATSFSLKPLQLPWTLLPAYGLLSMQAVFDTPAYTEFIAYVGAIGLGLAILGAWKGHGRARAFGVVLAVMGLALGLGRWNPLYLALHAAVPGFDLFRVPARWMLLYTFGAAVLAGLGAQWLLWKLPQKLGTRTAAWAAPILLLLVAADLLLAARSLPHTHPTAPEAVDGVRSAPAHLLTDSHGPTASPAASPAASPVASPAGGGRFLGLSTITYDPGDMPDYKRIMLGGSPPQLDQAAFDDLVIAQKVQELLVPNLALLWRIPSIDGFDGGVLPLQRYNEFAKLLIPPEQYVPDGRLREQLQAVPPANLLNLMNVQYLITDKVRDLWFEDVYYDRQIGARLDAAQPAAEIAVGQDSALQATHLDLIAYADAADDVWAALTDAAIPLASVTISSSEGVTQTFTVTAGGAEGAQLADGSLDSSLAQASGATVALRDVDAGRQEYRVRLPFAAPLAPQAIEVRLLDNRFTLAVQAATLFDARTGMFSALLPSDRGRFARVHSGDVKIYADQDLLPRATVVTQTLQADGPEQAAALLQEQLAHRPGGPVLPVVEGLEPLQATGGATAEAEIISYAPERIEIHATGDGPSLLVLADAFYPGWHTRVDGQEVPIYPANVLFRGVPLPAGDHSVVFTFEPAGWRLGLLAGGVALVLIAALGILAWWGFRRQRDHAV